MSSLLLGLFKTKLLHFLLPFPELDVQAVHHLLGFHTMQLINITSGQEQICATSAA
jgi:hypothetical protein